MGVSKNRGTQNGWFKLEIPIKMDYLGVPLFSETSICCVFLFWWDFDFAFSLRISKTKHRPFFGGVTQK